MVGILELPRSGTSTGAVAFGIVSLLPVELILQLGSSAGFAMVFALLTAAILWNRDLMVWTAGIELTHAHRLDHRGGHRQSINERQDRNQRRRLGASRQYRKVAAAFADFWVRRGLFAVDRGESNRQGEEAVRGSE